MRTVIDFLTGRSPDTLEQANQQIVANLREQNLKFQKFMWDRLQELETQFAIDREIAAAAEKPDDDGAEALVDEVPFAPETAGEAVEPELPVAPVAEEDESPSAAPAGTAWHGMLLETRPEDAGETEAGIIPGEDDADTAPFLPAEADTSPQPAPADTAADQNRATVIEIEDAEPSLPEPPAPEPASPAKKRKPFAFIILDEDETSSD